MNIVHRNVAALFLAFAVASCAGGGGGDRTDAPTTAAEDVKAASAAYARGDKDEYVRLLTRAIDAGTLPDANQSAAYLARSYIYVDKGQYERAIADCDAAIRIRVDYAEAYANRALAHTRSGQDDQAIADLDVAIRLKPDFTIAYNNRGSSYARKNKHEQAIADYGEAIRLRPDYAEAYVNRGLSYSTLEQFDRAIADYDEAIRLKPDYAWAYLDRGVAENAERRYDAALPDFDKALGLDQKILLGYRDRGLTQMALGRYDYAAADFARGLALQPGDTAVLLWLHVVRIKAGVDDHDEFTRNLTKIDRTRWPDPVAELYLERVTPEQLLAASRTGEPKVARERECFASYNIGEYQLLRKRPEAANAALQHAADTCSRGGMIGVLASDELRQMSR